MLLPIDKILRQASCSHIGSGAMHVELFYSRNLRSGHLLVTSKGIKNSPIYNKSVFIGKRVNFLSQPQEFQNIQNTEASRQQGCQNYDQVAADLERAYAFELRSPELLCLKLTLPGPNELRNSFANSLSCKTCSFVADLI